MQGPSKTPPIVPRTHAAQGHSSRVPLLSQQGKQGSPYQSPPGELSTSIMNAGMNSQLIDCQTVGPENPYASPSGQILQNNTMHIERKRKVYLCYLQ